MTDPIAKVQTGYDRWADIYDTEPNPLIALEEPIVRQMIGDPSGLDVLDLGCGTGRHALWLAENGANVTAMDFSEGMLAKARAKAAAARIRFIAHDLREPLPLGDTTFDLVISGLVLEHLKDLDPFFGEARRVLKPGGRAVISAMHPAMFLRGTQARFTDPQSSELVQPGSIAHSVSAFVMSAIRGGFQLSDIGEFAPDEQFAANLSRATRYVGWPMLVAMSLKW